jgi:hypothetical protein
MNKVTVTLSNPLNKTDTLDYVINVNDTPMGQRWFTALQDVVQRNLYLEKNFCFLGFPDNPRDINFICDELNKACNQINKFFDGAYYIDEVYTPAFIQQADLGPNQPAMNLLHNRFEILQGTVNSLSGWYKRADYDTKFAIRQLNNLCHEAESLMLSQRKKVEAPDWIRPSQITTFLNCPRLEFPDEYRTDFSEARYNRLFGEVYLHWTQIGKTLFEVYRDEQGVDIDQATCDAITHLRYYSGEFDIEWAQDVVYGGPHPWHTREIDGYREWLARNNFDLDDPQYNYGYHPVGQVDLQKSFGTTDFREIWPVLSRYLNIHGISTDDGRGGVLRTIYPYAYTDSDYAQQQIERLKPGYDYSSRG